jgi:GxxExxY protein
MTGGLELGNHETHEDILFANDELRGDFAGVDEDNHETHETHEKVLFADEVFAIQGAVFEVRRQMGPGFLEAVYQECLVLELAERNVPFLASPPLALTYKGTKLQQKYVPDFVCFDQIVLELKAVRSLAPEHRAQVINYLKGSGHRLGLLINFGAPGRVEIERFAL